MYKKIEAPIDTQTVRDAVRSKNLEYCLCVAEALCDELDQYRRQHNSRVPVGGKLVDTEHGEALEYNGCQLIPYPNRTLRWRWRLPGGWCAWSYSKELRIDLVDAIPWLEQGWGTVSGEDPTMKVDVAGEQGTAPAHFVPLGELLWSMGSLEGKMLIGEERACDFYRFGRGQHAAPIDLEETGVLCDEHGRPIVLKSRG